MRLFRRKDGDEAWQGVVVTRHRGMLDGSNMYHRLDLRLADGTTRSVRVGRTLWKSVAEGDLVSKQPGQPPAKAIA